MKSCFNLSNFFVNKNTDIYEENLFKYKNIVSEYIKNRISETLKNKKKYCKISNNKILNELNIKSIDKNSINLKFLQDMVKDFENENYYINLNKKNIYIYWNKKDFLLFRFIHYIVFSIVVSIFIGTFMIGFVMSTTETILMILNLFILTYVCYWVFIY